MDPALARTLIRLAIFALVAMRIDGSTGRACYSGAKRELAIECGS
jgi:hypothetical protein